MPKMIALKKHRYGMNNIGVNQIYDVSVHHVNLVRAMGWAAMYTVKAMTTENTSALVPNAPRVHENKAEHRPLGVGLDPVVEQDTLDANRSMVGTMVEEETQSQDHHQMLVDRAKSLGIHVDGRWSSPRLQREIDEYNRNTYQRRDMTAEE